MIDDFAPKEGKKFILPSLRSLIPLCPGLAEQFQMDFLSQIALPETTKKVDHKTQRSQIVTFSKAEDVTILYAVRRSYGVDFSGNLPWSFWDIYKKLTNSERSFSSLYHHWNRSLLRKYGALLSAARINDAISLAETAAAKSKRPRAR
jgi:hypothetical protein